MTALTKKIAIFFFCFVSVSDSFAGDDTRDEAFYDSVARRFTEEYIKCTGDTSPAIDVKRIIRWKQKMNEWTESREYAELLRDYRKTGAVAVLPCKLIEWSKKRKQAQEMKESTLIKRLLDSAEDGEMKSELRALTASRFDFAEIPFGISKPAFIYFFKKKFDLALIEKGRFLYIEDLPVNGRPFLSAFFFNDGGLFYKYEIESDPLPADSLNRVVRPSADRLAHFFEQRLGPALHTERVGFFDIKSKELALYKKWETPGNSLSVGYSVFDYHYYAKAVVKDKKLPQPGRGVEGN